MSPELRARFTLALEDLGRTDVGQLVGAAWRWLRRQLALERATRCQHGGCHEDASAADPDGGAGGLCIAHVSPEDYDRGHHDGRRDAMNDGALITGEAWLDGRELEDLGPADIGPFPEPGWAAAEGSGRQGAGPAYLLGYTDGYLGAPRR